MQSTDKNFMVRSLNMDHECACMNPLHMLLADTHHCVPGLRQVPVGGAIVAAPRSSTYLVEAVNKVYPGRASASPSLDLFMTLLHWGASGTAWQCSACKLLVHTLLHAMSAVQCAPPRAPIAGWQEALRQREALFPVLLSRLREFAARNGVSPQCHSLTEGAERFCGSERAHFSILTTMQASVFSTHPATQSQSA